MFVLDSANSNATRLWQPNPTTRGTWGIYQTCIITIGLCVWQSIHLNVPPPGEPRHKQILRKIGFAMTALIAPELVAFTAWSQYRQARKVMDAVNRSKRVTTSERLNLRSCMSKFMWTALVPIRVVDRIRMRRRHEPDLTQETWEQAHARREEIGKARLASDTPWTLEMSFYACSGGLVAEFEHGTLEHLTVEFVTFIIENELESLQLRHSDVMDRSKVDLLARIITCVQAFWFCTALITRLAQSLAVSLLELNTFAHCISAFVIYLFWWHKPYDVTSHTIITGRQARYLALAHHLGKSSGTTSWDLIPFWLDMLNAFSKDFPHWHHATIHAEQEDENQSLVQISVARHDLSQRVFAHRIITGDTIPETGFRLIMHKRPVTLHEGSGNPAMDHPSYVYAFSSETHKLWKELWSLHYEGIRLCRNPDLASANGHAALRKTLLGHRIENLEKISFDGRPLLILATSFVAYGSLHLLAWNYAFSSTAEQLLWKMASTVTAAFAPAYAAVTLPLKRIQTSSRTPEGTLKNTQKALFLLYWLCYLFIGLDILARVYLIFECFIAMPNSPTSVYLLPRWTAYVPHI